MRLLAYNQLFRGLAARYLDIAATPENGRFLRIQISADPIAKQIDLSGFYGALRSKLKAPNQAFLILENYQIDYDDNNGDWFARRLHGAFLVLKKTPTGNDEARDAAIDACEQIAEDILAALVLQLEQTYRVSMTLNDAFAEHVGPVGDGHVGVRINFSWKESAGEDLTYNPSKFL
ncbi:MAG TPA: hypothetical protein VF690_03010 [Hymenobacter sp.]|jgi:hypothetical protein